MKRQLGVALLLFLPVACVRQTHVAQSPLPTVWERQVRNARDAGEGDYALRTLRDKAAADPNNIPVRLELVKAYQDRGYPDIALEMCRLTAARFPDSGEVQLALVRALHATNRREEAVSGLEAFLNSHPQSGFEYSSWQGILRDEAGQWTEAEAAHRRALQAAPAADSLHNNLGYNLLLQQKYQPAAEEFREALKLNPHSDVAHNNLGVALANLDQTGDALANWQAVSDAATAHNNLAAIFIEKAKYPEARQELQLALSYNKAHPAALKNLELVSRLDGKPASLALKPETTLWKRVVAGLVWLMGGGPQNPRTDIAKTASAPPPGEEP
jgi:tetratricopeptide (TPR) repeat protein